MSSLLKMCNLLFHYGVYDLPLPCTFPKPRVAHLKTDISIPNKDVYEVLEFLSTDDMALHSNGTALPPSDPSSIDFSNLYPAVIECFAIILCGYAAGRGNLISQTESRGLNVFVGTFSLPSLIFMSMAKLDFSSVNWVFLSAICLSKTIVFVLVVLITLLVYRPTDYGKAGLYAIFCTQSNDFALGYPIVAALYGKDHPDFASYLYLAAPISLVYLNPIGFILMEIGKRKSLATERREQTSGHVRQSTCAMVLNIVKEFLTNPFIFMTALGIIANFVFHTKLPNILDGFLTVFGQAFSASALFLLGLSMVGKVHTLRGAALVTPGILIAVKTLILPLVTREVVSLLKPGIDSNATADYSNYGFLYGTFPTAPGVFVFASKYGVAVDMVASAMVACTFLSAPLMFISAKMVTLVTVGPLDYLSQLETFLFDVSIIGLICSIWVVIVFSLTKKWRKVPHFITLCLTISQAIACIGALMWSQISHDHHWKIYLQFFIFSFGVFSTRLWTALLAVTLFFLRWRSLSFVLRIRPYLALIGWGIPGILVGILVIIVEEEYEMRNDPNFQYGSTQAIVALLLLWFSLFTTVVCLILHQRFEKRYTRYESLLSADERQNLSRREDSPDGSPSSSRSFLVKDSATVDGNLDSPGVDVSPRMSLDSLSTQDDSEQDSLFNYSDRLTTSNRSTGRHKATSRQLTEPEELVILRDRDDEYQIMRHVVLLLLLCGSMIVGFALCMWTLVSPEVNGVYVELVFLDIVLNFGQGVFTAVIFGLDAKLIFVPLMKGWRRVMYGAPTIKLPPPENLSQKTKQTCDQFTSYHMDKCVKDIVRDRRWRLQQLPNVFAGTELVDWLILVGLAHDRTDAIKYGRHLLQGRVIRHTEDMHHFHDQPLFYTFRSREGSNQLP